MKIAVLTSSYPRFPGDGTAHFVQSICEHLAKLGHAVEVVAPYDPENSPVDHSCVRVHRFHYVMPEKLHIMGHARSLDADTRLRPLTFFLLPLFLVASFVALLRVTGRQKSDVIHVHWVLPNGPIAACMAIWRRIPFIVSLHGSDIFVAHRNRIFGAVARWVFHRAAAVTACSQELRDAAIALGARRDTRLLAWGADPKVFHPADDATKSRKSWGWSEAEIVVVALGRLVPKKGFDILIQALSVVVAHCPQVRLVIAGDGPFYGRLVQEAAEQGVSNRVTFLGRVAWDQVSDLLAAADIFVLPSVRDEHGNVDGLPTVLLEAMSVGAPVIASNIGGVGLVVKNEENGILVPPGDPTALADALLLLVENGAKRREIGRAARRAVEEEFNWRMVAQRIVELMGEVTHQ